MRRLTHIFLLTVATLASTLSAEEKTHLFILSGQSNMARLDPGKSFTPAVEAVFGKEHVIVVKDAQSGQPIRRWYRKWPEVLPDLVRVPRKIQTKPADGVPEVYGDLYDRLMAKVSTALSGRVPDTVTFIWMQGEADAKEGNDIVYVKCLSGLIKQLSNDMKRDDINYVIGRLSQFSKDSHWEGIRKAQVAVAESSPCGAWIDTDDIEIKGIHYTADGSKNLGLRFADKAVDLINRRQASRDF